MHPVRTISRKDLGEEALTRPRVDVDLLGILRDYTPNPCRNQWEDIVRSMWRHVEAGRNDRPRQTPILTFPLPREKGQMENLMSNNMPKVAKSLVG